MCKNEAHHFRPRNKCVEPVPVQREASYRPTFLENPRLVKHGVGKQGKYSPFCVYIEVYILNVYNNSPSGNLPNLVKICQLFAKICHYFPFFPQKTLPLFSFFFHKTLPLFPFFSQKFANWQI